MTDMAFFCKSSSFSAPTTLDKFLFYICDMLDELDSWLHWTAWWNSGYSTWFPFKLLLWMNPHRECKSYMKTHFAVCNTEQHELSFTGVDSTHTVKDRPHANFKVQCMYGPVAKTICQGAILLCQCTEWLWQEIALRVTKQAKHIFRLLSAHLDLVVQLRGQDSSALTQSSNSLWGRVRASKPTENDFFSSTEWVIKLTHGKTNSDLSYCFSSTWA